MPIFGNCVGNIECLNNRTGLHIAYVRNCLVKKILETVNASHLEHLPELNVCSLMVLL